MTEALGTTSSPFDRLKEHFNNLPALEDIYRQDERRMLLDDGTNVSIRDVRITPTAPISGYNFECRPAAPNSNQHIYFIIDEDGLKMIHIPGQEFRVGGIKIRNMSPSKDELWRTPKEEKTKVATALVDWVDQVMKERKYTPPPYSIAMLTDFK